MGYTLAKEARGWLRHEYAHAVHDQCETAPTSYASRAYLHSVEDTVPYTAICMIAEDLRHLEALQRDRMG
jgi:hypothetical protein